jgi:tRNA dimethylallyltransferase
MTTHHPVSPSESLPPLIVLVGPTAVGKTGLALALADAFDGEIVNADSRLFYRGMDIGTAKPSPEERARVPHHLIDFLHPNDPISLATFQDLAYGAIDDILARRRLPFLVGGTPQYVNAVTEGWQIPRVEPDPRLRARLQAEADAHGIDHLEARLREVDPEAATRNAGNLRRIIRALEVWEKTGRPITEQQSKGPARYEPLELELWRPRDDLRERISERAEEQVRASLFEEVRTLIALGANPDSPSFSSIGYRQVVPYLRGEATAEEVVERIRFDSHRLVRHQETWWRKNPRLVRIDMSRPDGPAEAHRRVAAFLDKRSTAPPA